MSSITNPIPYFVFKIVFILSLVWSAILKIWPILALLHLVLSSIIQLLLRMRFDNSSGFKSSR